MSRKIRVTCQMCQNEFMVPDDIEIDGNPAPPKVSGVALFTSDYIQKFNEQTNSFDATIDNFEISSPLIICPTCEAVITGAIESRDPQFRNRQIQQSMQDYAEEYHRVKMDEEMAGSKPLSLDSLEKNGIDPDYLEEDE